MNSKKARHKSGVTAKPSPARGEFASLEIGAPPEGQDARTHAEYFLQMLGALAKQGSPEAKRIRAALVQMLEDYKAATDKEAAYAKLAARVAEVEAGTIGLLLQSIRRVRDDLSQKSRKLGTASRVGRATRAAAESFATMAKGMETVLRANETGDAKLREQAQEMMRQARAGLETVEHA